MRSVWKAAITSIDLRRKGLVAGLERGKGGEGGERGCVLSHFHDRIRALMSVGVSVGSSVGMVMVEAALGSGVGSAVAAVAAVVFLIGAMMRLSR